MTTEPTYGCKGCGSPVFVSLKDKHRTVCPAVIANQLYQFRQTHGGQHVQIEDAIKTLTDEVKANTDDLESVDKDIQVHEARIAAIEDRPTTHDTVAPDGVTITGWLDDDTDQPTELAEPDEDDEEPEPIAAETPEEPTYPALAPVYSTATSPAEVDDLEARIAAQTSNGLHL